MSSSSAVPLAAPTPQTDSDLKVMANAIRALSMDAVEAAKSGHPGMPMGCADIAAVLWTQVLKYDAAAPEWPDRDRFVLSAGHGSMLLYAVAYLTGYAAMPLSEIKRFRQFESRTPGHPEHDVAIGVETTTGPLGQGFANAVGMAIAERALHARFGDGLVDHFTYVLASDGDLMEGISHEAASLAGHLGLRKLIVLYDDNKISIDGPTSLSFTDDTLARFRAYGFDVAAVDGHDAEALAAALKTAQASTKPSLIACRTVIGFGAPQKAGTEKCHGSPLGTDEIKGAREKLGWTAPAFEIPEKILAAWRGAGQRGQEARKAWEARYAALDPSTRAAFDLALSGQLPAEVAKTLAALKTKLASDKPAHATRQSSGLALEALMPVLPCLLGGSADLSGSNNTQTKAAGIFTAAEGRGRYLHYGVREHGMAAAMNGMALHGGIIPYGGTFLQFADYCRPAIRLAALMRQRVVFVMTHDSIGLGEDGPTHQPAEHLAALRAIPNLWVLRPCDGIETAECWQIALARQDGPSVIVLSRQAVPTLRDGRSENAAARGGYVLAEAKGKRQATLIATGTEVSIALEAQAQLASQGIAAAVVSLPSMELFFAEDSAYRASVLGDAPRFGVEAAIRQGWDAVLGNEGEFIGMRGFGASAPAPELYRHFGITAEAIAKTVAATVQKRP